MIDKRTSEPLGRQMALAVAMLVAVYAGYVAADQPMELPAIRSDVDQLWFAARMLLEGRDPYALIGPGREFNYAWPLLYPLPAVLALIPLAPFPAVVARVVMVALPSGILAYSVARTDPRNLVLFLSKAFYVNAWYAQWTPLLMCMLFIPAFSAFVVAKPTIGAAMLVGVPDWRRLRWPLTVAAVIVLLSVIVWPYWHR
jgi:hypothetical protein